MDALSLIFDDIHLAKSEYLYLNLWSEGGFHYRYEPSMLAYVVLQGNAYLTFEDADCLALKQGDLILLTSATPHRLQHQPHSTLQQSTEINPCFERNWHQPLSPQSALAQNTTTQSLVLAIRAKLDIHMAGPLLQSLPKSIYIQHITKDTAPKWLQIGLQFLSNEGLEQKPGHDKILDHLVSILLIECVRDYILNLQDAENWLNALSHPELSNALAAIHAQPELPWTVESLAERCCMSRSKFAQLFSHIVQQTPLAYLQHHRLRLAAQYLRDSQHSVQQIAHLVGYSSETAFSQSFKKLFELTPSQYRQQTAPKSV